MALHKEETNYLMGVHGLFIQGSHIEPAEISGKIIFWNLFVTCWFLWASHSATLSSLLAVKIDKAPFINLVDMMSNTNYKVMFHSGDGEMELFKV